MATVRELHHAAMLLAQDALIARHTGEYAEEQRLAAEALVIERQAVDMVPLEPASEPTRSILYRSAASLALQASNHEEARRLIAEARRGSPPPRVMAELDELEANMQEGDNGKE